MRRVCGLALFVAAGSALLLAQPIPAGWKAGTDVRKVCQIAAPVCTVSFTHANSADEPTLAKIADTLQVVK